MEQSGIHEILHALKLYSSQVDKKLDEMKTDLENKIDHVKSDLENKIDHVKSGLESKIDNMKSDLENRMDERFDRIETKLNGFRVELTETQETVDYLSIKTAQHEKKLRNHVDSK
ncbi:hypothetical protein J1P26_14620 [Neobacillus sp. MM2021_6]|uniref:hypothetical protein n=1 Tax=Bacillaceae TaxID=186817 RepID=UPI00140C80DE|nr:MULTISPECIES: hypothetical protein [Bacillaceae]MBO0960932.1 hypothetical protein [Neobacillus sp. MM2021_6]NHC20782.1 hypothetical protein [Bacillus sp. MM2020_4]